MNALGDSSTPSNGRGSDPSHERKRVVRRHCARFHANRRAPALTPLVRATRLFICVTLKFPRVPARVSEALVLRTYPLKEADLVVSFLTRDQGRLRGVAKRARRPKSAFGSGL